jgi:hypothetical protein
MIGDPMSSELLQRLAGSLLRRADTGGVPVRRQEGLHDDRRQSHL